MSEWTKAFDRTPLEPEKPWSPPGSRAVVALPLLDLSELTGDAEGRYATFTLRQWTGTVERAHIIFSHNDWGRRRQGIGHRGQLPLPPAIPLAPPMLMTALNCSNHLSGSLVKTSSLTPHPPTLHVQTSLQSWTWPKMTSFTSQTQPRTLIVNSLTQTQLLSPTSTEYRLPTHR